MIYTCSLTPSIDYTVYLPEFCAGALNRTQEVYYYPGGKGINVSRVLKRLGEASVALGFTGGFTGEYITKFLKQEGIQTNFVQTSEITRINVKIKADMESELNGPGPHITVNQQNQLRTKLNDLNQGDWFVLAGSLPNKISPDFYQSIAEACMQKGARFVLDTSGPALKKLINARPFFIKPNIDELGELFHTTVTSTAQACKLAKQLTETGIKHVIVSMGGDGAIYVSENETIIAKAPNGHVVNTVGAGDSLVAGFITSFIQHHDPIQAFRFGVASGSATAFQPDLCIKEDVMKLLDKVEITPFKDRM
ncbi:1-phosphofructokinase [Lentibacillus sp. N15]|uniref:1-phosphofructokinase n=1 Tax=Lentibacillus songyuanensis TaxID=3136161 RepID=UPI0031BA78BC